MKISETNHANQKMLDAKTAGQTVGYSSDYVTRLAREGKIEAMQAGRHWLVDLESLKLFTLQVQAEKRERAKKIREERKRELAMVNVGLAVNEDDQIEKIEEAVKTNRNIAFAQTVAVSLCVFLFSSLVWISVENKLNYKNLAASADWIAEEIYSGLFGSAPDFLSQLASFAFLQRPNIEVVGSDKKETPHLDSSSDSFEGIVVLDGDVDDAEIRKIKESFSDEVRVDLTREGEGVITPVFREVSDETYRFVLVPVNPDSE